MALKEALKTDMVKAMKAKEKIRLSTLRSALSSITDAETKGKERRELTDSDVIAVLKKLVKTRRESAVIYKEAEAYDRSEAENTEADILEEYLPQQKSEEEVRALVNEIIENNGLAESGARGIGQVMKELKNRNDVDSALASKIAREILQ